MTTSDIVRIGDSTVDIAGEYRLEDAIVAANEMLADGAPLAAMEWRRKPLTNIEMWAMRRALLNSEAAIVARFWIRLHSWFATEDIVHVDDGID